MNWFSIAFSAVVLIALGGLVSDHIRARRESRAGPFTDMTLGMTLFGVSFIVPVLVVGFNAIQFVLT